MHKITLDFEKPLIHLEQQLDVLKKSTHAQKSEIAGDISNLEKQIEKLRLRIYTRLTPWHKVQIARHPERPVTSDYVNWMVTDFIDLHGDRIGGDDKAIIGGFGTIGDHRVVIVGQEKGSNTKERMRRNFGMPHPEGFRKSLRLAKIAEKFKLPLVCFIDTSGAYPGIEAEERGQAIAISENIMAFSLLKTKIIAINIAEGGSGGALALGVADKVLMLENAYYSVISPEACSSILFSDVTKASEAAEILKLTAQDQVKAGFIDEIIEEPLGGAHKDKELTKDNVYKGLINTLDKLNKQPIEKLLEKRFQKIRKMGTYKEQKIRELT